MEAPGPVTPSLARPRPCASCPYRRDVPSGVWAAHEYEKLPDYDAPTACQPIAAFGCHQADGRICAGWLGCHDPQELLAVRIGVLTGSLDPSVTEYTTDVPLFASGAEAAEHGLADLEDPSPDAARVMAKLLRARAAKEVD